jgi:TonB family protein
VDRSFQGLVLSLCFHAFLVWLILHSKAENFVSHNEPTEVTFIEKDQTKTKAKTFVMETEKKEPDLRTKLDDTAEFLSAFTKRVKKQIVARNTGETRNQKPQKANKGDSQGIAGMQARGEGDDGFLRPGSGGTAMRQVVIGPSSIGERITGVEEGDFTALNTDQFTYYSFFARINEQVRNRWVAYVRQYIDGLGQKELEYLSRQDRQTVVEIILAPGGEFASSVLHNSSGDSRLDQTTVEAFRAAAPFLNPPKGMIEADGNIHLRYGFHIRFRPPGFGPAMN